MKHSSLWHYVPPPIKNLFAKSYSLPDNLAQPAGEAYNSDVSPATFEHQDMMKSRWFNPVLPLGIAACLLASCNRSDPMPTEKKIPGVSADPSVAVIQKAKQMPAASPIVAAARSQVGKTVIYDPAYVGLPYPGGDLPIEKGVCSDVVVRALRDAFNADLQKLVHEDMQAAFSEYPTTWGLKKPDRNIDHRRVPNLKRYFERQGYSVAVTQKKEDYLPGDLVTCTVGRNLAHIMIVSDKKTRDGVPFVIHNIGSGAKEENRLFDFPMTGHYRIKDAARTRQIQHTRQPRR